MNALLRLPRLEPQTTTVSKGVAPSNPPPIGSCWSHDGETIMVSDSQKPVRGLYTDESFPVLAITRGVDGDAKGHEAAFWKQVEVYEP